MLNNRQLFIKSLTWALIGSAVFVALFLLITGFGHILRSPGSARGYVNGILYSSIVGNLVGAGLVGWRVVDKYQPKKIQSWLLRYISSAAISVVVATGILYTPLTGTLVLWNLFAALLVVWAKSNKPYFNLLKRLQK